MQAQQLKTALVLLVIAAGAAPSCQAARLLKNRFYTEDDPSGYTAYTAARSITPLGTKVRNANTPEAAESTSNAAFLGVYRASAAGGSGKLSYATVEGTVGANPDHRKEFVKTRTRSAQDLGGLTPRPVNIAGGAVQVPVLVTNGAALAQTYEGATAASMPEALIVNQGGRGGNRKTVVANSMLTSTTAPAPKASKIASLASTAQPVGSLALSGTANGKIVLAQADSAVAMAQTERVDRVNPISRTAWQN